MVVKEKVRKIEVVNPKENIESKTRIMFVILKMHK
jgi:hypothetical protein